MGRMDGSMLIFRSPGFFSAHGCYRSSYSAKHRPMATSGGALQPVKRPPVTLYRLLRHSVRQRDSDSATRRSSDNGRNPAKLISMYSCPATMRQRHRKSF